MASMSWRKLRRDGKLALSQTAGALDLYKVKLCTGIGKDGDDSSQSFFAEVKVSI